MKSYLLLITLVASIGIYSVIESNKNQADDGRKDPNGSLPIIQVDNFRYIVDGDSSNLKVQLPENVQLLKSNNCVGIYYFQDRLFIGFRSAPSHFAAKTTKIFILSSKDNGTQSWDFEKELFLGTDMREPNFYSFNNTLVFTFFQAGKNPRKFQPQHLFRIRRQGFQQWSQKEEWGNPGEIVWQIQEHNGQVYTSSYIGTHYQSTSFVKLFLNQSDDGSNFNSVRVMKDEVYEGGVSELGFTFNDKGDIFAIGRNEDGDKSGSGSRYWRVRQSELYNNWSDIFPSPQKSNPDIFESPRMFTWNNQTFLVGRRDLNPPFDRAWKFLPFALWKYYNLITYSLRAHTTAIWLLDQDTMQLTWMVDLPGCGDNAFPSILQVSENKFTIANYASPLNHPNWSWVKGQLNPTQIYFIDVEFLNI